MLKTRHKIRSFLHILKRSVFALSLFAFGITFLSLFAMILSLTYVETVYAKKVYPHVFTGIIDVSGRTKEEIATLWDHQNIPYKRVSFELHLDSQIATISGEELNLGFDNNLIAEQAYLVGRSGNFFSDIYTKILKQNTVITPYFRWNEGVLDAVLTQFAEAVREPPQDALFQFTNGRVTEFKPSHPGKQLNKEVARLQVHEQFTKIPYSSKTLFPVFLSVEPVPPKVSMDKANTFGIKERIGMGYSEFHGSIPGRIYNVQLAASKFNGVLIPPGGVLSYNDIVGDISTATGFQQAYIIKDGRTVLGDGGGVCQVSTTLFRAALSAGLPIIERTAHAYRVHYYEDGGYKAGLDATVFAPSVDLKIKNDTPAHILVQTKTDTRNSTLTIEFYGTHDGRKAEILNHTVSQPVPPPPPLYQDDPTLPKGTTKQVDWAAWGAKAVFQYKVTRGKETLIDQNFVSLFRPWQAVYLQGTKE